MLPLAASAQKVKGVVTYMDKEAQIHTNVGEQVYLIPCKKCDYKDFFFITEYTLSNSLDQANSTLISKGGHPEASSTSADTVALYKGRIDSLIGKNTSTASVDGAGNYSFEGLKTGRYLLLFECNKCEAYRYEVVEVKATGTVKKDEQFICL